MTLGHALRVSQTIPVLLVLSVLVVTIALERLHALWVAHRLPEHVWDRIKERLEVGDQHGALGLCRLARGTMGRALEQLISLPEPTTERLVECFQVHRQRLNMELNRRVGFFGTASFIAPLIGLLGTVLGIMRAFRDLAAAGAGGPTVVAAGISEALVATAAGIGVAVLSAVFYNLFVLTARSRLNTADLWVFELAQLLTGRPRA